MEAEIHPRPNEDEEAAILEAIAAPEPGSVARSAWWRAGVDENFDPDVGQP